MQAWVTEVMGQFGYIGILFTVALENVFAEITATIGSILGAIALYGVDGPFASIGIGIIFLLFYLSRGRVITGSSLPVTREVNL